MPKGNKTISESTIDNVLAVMTGYANEMEKRFKENSEDMAMGFSQLRKELTLEISRAEWRIMDHFDGQVFKVKGDLLVMDKKADAKSTAVVEVLRKKNVITKLEQEHIQSTGPFVRQ